MGIPAGERSRLGKPRRIVALIIPLVVTLLLVVTLPLVVTLFGMPLVITLFGGVAWFGVTFVGRPLLGSGVGYSIVVELVPRIVLTDEPRQLGERIGGPTRRDAVAVISDFVATAIRAVNFIGHRGY